MVECNLAKVDVAGSNPVSRSTKKGGIPKWLRERSAKPLCSGSNPDAASTIKRPNNAYWAFLCLMTHATQRLKKLLQGFCYHFRQCIDYPNIIESLEGT